MTIFFMLKFSLFIFYFKYNLILPKLIPMNSKILNKIAIALILITLAVITRLSAHENQLYNFTAVGSVLLFSTFYFKNSKLNFLFPIAIMFISDLFLLSFFGINNQPTGNYLAFLVYVIMSSYFIKKIKIKNVALAGVSGATLFFLISNFLVWFNTGIVPDGEYSLTLGGLFKCYAKAFSPFYTNQLMADLVWSAIIFGVYELSIYSIKNLSLNRKNY